MPRRVSILAVLVALALAGCAATESKTTKHHNPINELFYGGGPEGQKPVEESERRERQAESEKSEDEWRAEVDKCTYRKLGYVPVAGHTPQEESCEAAMAHGGPKTGATKPECAGNWEGPGGTEPPYGECQHAGERLVKP